MHTPLTTRPPNWFTVFAVLALLWNVVGLFAVVMNFMITPEQLAQMSPAEQQLYADSPVWSSYASLLAVLSGSVGCIALLFKKAWAAIAFVVSIGALIAQNIALFVIVDAASVVGNNVLYMQALVALIAFILFYLARYGQNQQWLD